MAEQIPYIIDMLKRGARCWWERDMDDGACVLDDEILRFDGETYVELITMDEIDLEYPNEHQTDLVLAPPVGTAISNDKILVTNLGLALSFAKDLDSELDNLITPPPSELGC